MIIENTFFELIQVSLGTRVCLSRTPSDHEWKELYEMAKKQSLVGVCFAGVQRLIEQHQSPEEMLYLTWMGMAAKIQQRNETINKQCVELQGILAKEGFRSCILKGQGNADNYRSLALLRQSGDIDIWIEGGYEKVMTWVQKVAPTKEVNQHHAHVDIFPDTEVEAHYYPFHLSSPLKNKILKTFFAKSESVEFEHRVKLPNGESIVAASNEFNLVFHLVHVFHHLFTEGVGLRQVMDYYMVLRARNNDSDTACAYDDDNLHCVIKELGLERFASALIWVIGHVFDREMLETWNQRPETALWTPNEKDGQFLLNEIMQSGNFGKRDERQKGLYDSKWNSFWCVQMKTFRFRRFDPWAWFWSPIGRVYGKISKLFMRH